MSAAAPDTLSSAATVTAPPSAPQVIDLTTLLTPFAGENPCGENLQYSGLYDEIREARRADDMLAQGDWEREPKVAEWHKVIDLADDALTNKTKDLQIGAWFTEGLVQVHGFVGLRDGLRLIRGLHENFWDGLYPTVEDGDLEARANALSFMDGKLELPLKSLPLTNSGSGVNYSYLQWEDSTKFDIPDNIDSLEAAAYERATQLKQQAEAEGKTTAELWRKAKDASRRAYYEPLFALVNECWAEYQALDKVMDQRFDRQTPGLGVLKKTLESIISLVEKLVKEKRILEPDPVADEPGTAAGDNAQSSGRGSGGPVSTRADALRRLAEVADYFQRAEPHSPVAYLVQRAIKWGQMPLELWLEDVIKDGNVLGHLKETLGFNTTSTDDQGTGS